MDYVWDTLMRHMRVRVTRVLFGVRRMVCIQILLSEIVGHVVYFGVENLYY